MIAIVAVCGYLLTALALHWSSGLYDPASLLCLVAALTLVCAGIGWPAASGVGPARQPLRLPLPSWFTPNIVLGVCLLGYAGPVGWLLATSQPPSIDVWQFQQQSCQHLLEGRNPYSQQYTDIDLSANPYGAELVKDGKVQSFPYPPLSLVLALPGYGIMGDVRWSMWAALPLAAICLSIAGRRVRHDPSAVPGVGLGEMATVALLFQPNTLALLLNAWTEPFVALSIAWLVWAIAGGRPLATPIALASVLAVKQYTFLLLPAFLAARQISWRDTAIAIALAVLTGAPFFLWDPAGFKRGMVDFHVYNVFRTDALSIPVYLFQISGWQAPASLALVAWAAVAGLCVKRRKSQLDQAILGAAALLLAFFVCAKWAFFNYYWLTNAILAMTLGVTKPSRNVEQAAI